MFVQISRAVLSGGNSKHQWWSVVRWVISYKISFKVGNHYHGKLAVYEERGVAAEPASDLYENVKEFGTICLFPYNCFLHCVGASWKMLDILEMLGMFGMLGMFLSQNKHFLIFHGGVFGSIVNERKTNMEPNKWWVAVDDFLYPKAGVCFWVACLCCFR